jgi:superfamily II DNA/RNA helicase
MEKMQWMRNLLDLSHASSVTAHKWEHASRTHDVFTENNITFAGLMLSNQVEHGLAKAGFERPSPIQLKAIPLGRCGFDLVVQAKSGTGKTCVFVTVALEIVDTTMSSVQVIVLAPTREIAVQIQEVINAIGCSMPYLQCHTFIGGLPLSEDIAKLKNCHIAVATPGRLKQLIFEKILDPDAVRLFILDEADKLMEQDFQQSINWIYSSLPANKQMMALSATYPERLALNIKRYMHCPMFVRLNVCDPALLGVRQFYKLLPHNPLAQKQFEIKCTSLLQLLSTISFHQCLVFTNYHTRAESLNNQLKANGWPSAYINGSQDQANRLTALAELKNFHCRILISTDLTSRGIDAINVNLVVNLDVPRDSETYLHRIGRAGRFGTYGAAITVICGDKEMACLKCIEKHCNVSISPLPESVPADLAQYACSESLCTMVSAIQIEPCLSDLKCNLTKPANMYVAGVAVDSCCLDSHQNIYQSGNIDENVPLQSSSLCILQNHWSYGDFGHYPVPMIPVSVPELCCQVCDLHAPAALFDDVLAEYTTCCNIDIYDRNFLGEMLSVELNHVHQKETNDLIIAQILASTMFDHKERFPVCAAILHSNSLVPRKIGPDHLICSSTERSLSCIQGADVTDKHEGITNIMPPCFTRNDLLKYQACNIPLAADVIARIDELHLAQNVITCSLPYKFVSKPSSPAVQIKANIMFAQNQVLNCSEANPRSIPAVVVLHNQAVPRKVKNIESVNAIMTDACSGLQMDAIEISSYESEHIKLLNAAIEATGDKYQQQNGMYSVEHDGNIIASDTGCSISCKHSGVKVTNSSHDTTATDHLPIHEVHNCVHSQHGCKAYHHAVCRHRIGCQNKMYSSRGNQWFHPVCCYSTSSVVTSNYCLASYDAHMHNMLFYEMLSGECNNIDIWKQQIQYIQYWVTFYDSYL